MYNEEQSYDTESTSFNITSSLSPSLSYNYNLLVICSDRTVASYTGPLWTASTTNTVTVTSVLPSSTDNTVASSTDNTVASSTVASSSSPTGIYYIKLNGKSLVLFSVCS